MNAVLVRNGASIDYIPVADIEAGTIVVQGQIVGVANHKIEAGKLGSLELGGVYAVTKAAATAVFAVGDPIYLDADCKAVAEDANKGTFGVAVRASANGDEVVEALLINTGMGTTGE